VLAQTELLFAAWVCKESIDSLHLYALNNVGFKPLEFERFKTRFGLNVPGAARLP